MTAFQYISVFSGIGGLEHPSIAPVIVCERDPDCQTVLARRFSDAIISPDISNLRPTGTVDVVAGGWPCQDLSSAGTLGGISGARSGLFFEMLRVAKESGAHTLVGENVPNLLTINRGRDFNTVLDALVGAGYVNIGWRTLNAREFGLPQERRRLFIVASTEPARAAAIHAELPHFGSATSAGSSCGFYWTGGKRSICFLKGCVPTLKIGSTDNKGRAPVALFVNGRIRKLTPQEFLRLQGFATLPVEGLAASALLRMAGNAVAAPMGHFVMNSVSKSSAPSGVRTAFGVITESGLLDGGLTWAIEHSKVQLATNLDEFLDDSASGSLSAQAAAGLIVRSIRAGNPMPRELFDALFQLSADRSGKLHRKSSLHPTVQA